jgi:quinone-modifying oxidoreductase subunit QmoC
MTRTDLGTAAVGQRVRPDAELVRHLLGAGGEDVRKCMQCATCSAVCELARESNPGPRKEMLWAQWGLRDRLMSDPDIWLCHQCGDCTLRCPRGARPGDVMAALRREAIVYHATPRVLGRVANRAHGPLVLALFACAVLGVGVALWHGVGLDAQEAALSGSRMAYPFWPRLPHGLIASMFGAVIAFDVAVLVRGGRRFWRGMDRSDASTAPLARTGGLRQALARILWHDDFGLCSASQVRRTHHALVVYGVLALVLTSLWVATARWNPLLSGLVYPLGWWNPWKVMANLAGTCVLVGATLMLIERWRRPKTAGATRAPDLSLLVLLVLIVATGFLSELLHFARIDSVRFASYAVHLVCVLVLLLMLPYSKLAHVVYRTLAIAHTTRESRGPR